MTHKLKTGLSGAQLVADFQSALVTIATENSATFEAVRSEKQLVQDLERISKGDYLNPVALQSDPKAYFAHASLDAHIKKVQSAQVVKASQEQLSFLEHEVSQNYKGLRVRVRVLSDASHPIECVWFDERSGFRTSVYGKRVIEGTVDNTLIDKNVIILRPGFGRRLLNSNLKSYLIYVIDPSTLQPSVSIDIV